MGEPAPSTYAGRFRGKVVLVCGCGTGAGRATALRFGLEGAKLAIVARSEANVRGASELLASHQVEHIGLRTDVSSRDGAERVARETVEAFGRLDVLVSTAGGYESAPFDETDEEALERMLTSNLRTAFHTAKAAVPHIEKSGGGAIVITSAVFGAQVPGPGLLAYNTSKAASAGMIRSMAGDLVLKNIRLNAILPGAISHTFDPARDAVTGRRLLEGTAMPQDIAAAATFLASDEACWITGASLVVDGGFSVTRKAW